MFEIMSLRELVTLLIFCAVMTFSPGPNVYDIFLPDEGTYDIWHQIIGQGGIVGGTATQKITVEKSDPKAGNLIKGGKFTDAADVAQWTLTFSNPNGTDGFALWTWGAGSATFTATKWNRMPPSMAP